MVEDEERLVRVVWEAPFTVQEALKKHGANDYGIYQVYSAHIVFGPGSLVYIGKADEQKFGKRFSQHQDWLKHESDVMVRIGRLYHEDYATRDQWQDWSGTLADVEALTIYWHSPPYNSHHITDYKRPTRLRVRNMGDRGRLLPEYSSHWKPLRPDPNQEK